MRSSDLGPAAIFGKDFFFDYKLRDVVRFFGDLLERLILQTRGVHPVQVLLAMCRAGGSDEYNRQEKSITHADLEE
ncbi:hypothetical protein [Novosphingopyxis baekryungensis]|uniref:hypothetical protein n=1 Tax=Novosphingopyxis baekryungensis TaxID=279369 RepID=UPI0012EC782C|nr:hypothetical protein [Novosphingopyxis baekryungensis]